MTKKKTEKKKGKPSKYPERNIARKMGIPLDQFAKAKRSKYDKQARLEKKAALQAKRANDYRRLKNRFIEQGHLPQPGQPGFQANGEGWNPDMSGNQLNQPPKKTEEEKAAAKAEKQRIIAEKQEAEKERQAAKRAKNKAKKDRKEARKAEEAALNPPPVDPETGEPIPKPKKPKPLRGPAAKPLAHQLKMQAKLAKRKVLKANKKIAREKRKAEQRAKKEREAEKERQRKTEKKKMKQKTKSGQPVMAHRVEKIVGQLQASQA